MEPRLALAGVAILIVSITFLIYGILVDNNVVLGIAISSTLVGIVSVVTGLTYSEPLENLLNSYAKDLNFFLVRVLEDMGIIDKHKVKLCLDEKTLVFSREKVACNDIHLGIGVSEGVPYLAVKVENIVNAIADAIEDTDILVNKFLKVLKDIIKVCNNVYVSGDGGIVVVELIGLTKMGKALTSIPINIAKTVILAITALHLKKNVEIVEEVLSGERYVVKVVSGGV